MGSDVFKMKSFSLNWFWCFFGLTLFNIANVRGESTLGTYETNCSSLRMGQYMCPSPEIDPSTQQPKVTCTALEEILCIETGNNTFIKEIPCLWTNGYSFETSFLLSIFLGMFGADRFYLGYPALGLFKLCTLGCMFLGQIVDIILIATQMVTPADGSHYVINYFGPRLVHLSLDNDTYCMPQPDWPDEL